MSTIEPLVDQTTPTTAAMHRKGTGALESSVDDLLGEARTFITPALRASVAALPYNIRLVASYHFGWTNPDGSRLAAEGSWGKGLRPALVLACARAVGGDASMAVPAAAAVELVHQASIIQDDVIDHDAVRRHRPAVWTVYGIPAAVLVADALFFASIRALLGGSPQHTVAATETFIDDVQCLVAGELTDTHFETRRKVSLAACWTMTAAKTGALMESACALGARLGNATPQRIREMGRFGHSLGMAFQAVDDYLGIWGTGLTGKPVLADLKRRKKSLPVAYAMATQTTASAELAAVYGKDGQLTDREAELAAALIEQTGARAWVITQARAKVATALDHLAAARPTADGLDQLTAIARIITDRQA
ncbi:polyprenyl synthetase family protein [Nocardia abscessus]|uniref:Polyprenyl synthetase family protein n=1 Tax=Nocardia abscessus TaxID=120957 RepID=A0ABS0CIC8_9NOCA|nr:polyprenyl synthetase family protein [Nocardia abscessus]MBF6229277.1 polyprenyl synthetase family protein [Nocardia abscessus]